MKQWTWVLLISGTLLIIYLLFFYLSSIFRRGSPLYIHLSYYAKPFLRQLRSLGPRLKTLIPKPKLALAKPLGRQTFSKAEAAKPSKLRDVLPKAESVKSTPARKQEEQGTVRKPDTRPGFAGPTTEPFSLTAARQAVKEQRRVWIKYKDHNNYQSEEKVEIYRATAGGLRVWGCSTRKRDSLRRHRVIAWHVLDERFERTPHLEQWASGVGLIDLPEWLEDWLRKREQPR
jgi:predicted DNA-binding transcriptional regulator YafY